MDEGNLYNQPVAIDNGSGYIKAGFAGEERPKCYSPTIVGRPKYQKVMAGLLLQAIEPSVQRYNNDEAYIGSIAQQNRGLLKLAHPIEHGVVSNWDDMERIWHYTYTHDLKTGPEDHPLLITEAPLNPRANRDQMCQILFETLGVPCVYVSIQAVLSLYASGRTTGVVVDIGDGVSHVVPVYDGFSLPTSVKRMDVAGRDITEHLSFNIRRMSGVTFQSSAELDIVRAIKEKSCFVSKDPARDEKRYLGVPYSRYLSPVNEESDLFTSYKLPDGHTLTMGVEQFRAPEILFNPLLIGEESPGIHELTTMAIAKTDLDLRPSLYQNILLSGGSTLLKNFGDRMITELKSQQLSLTQGWTNGLQMENHTKIKIFAPPERKYSTWIGGSILAGLSTFRKLWVSALEYAADPDIVHRKFM